MAWRSTTGRRMIPKNLVKGKRGHLAVNSPQFGTVPTASNIGSGHEKVAKKRAAHSGGVQPFSILGGKFISLLRFSDLRLAQENCERGKGLTRIRRCAVAEIGGADTRVTFCLPKTGITEFGSTGRYFASLPHCFFSTKLSSQKYGSVGSRLRGAAVLRLEA